MIKNDDPSGNNLSTYIFKDQNSKKVFQNTLKKETQVMYRASPDDKHLFAAAMKQSGTICAVTGEGINDAMALSEVDVGFCMGSGNQATKDHASIIILDDNFASIFNAVKWGRNIFANCRKFIQF
jgi:Ca2+-transporting ATPase